jgi:hypothetical protein
MDPEDGFRAVLWAGRDAMLDPALPCIASDFSLIRSKVEEASHRKRERRWQEHALSRIVL